MIKKIILTLFFVLFINQLQAKENIMIMKLKDGEVILELFSEVAPNHVKRFKQLVKEKKERLIFNNATAPLVESNLREALLVGERLHRRGDSIVGMGGYRHQDDLERSHRRRQD